MSCRLIWISLKSIQQTLVRFIQKKLFFKEQTEKKKLMLTKLFINVIRIPKNTLPI